MPDDDQNDNGWGGLLGGFLSGKFGSAASDSGGGDGFSSIIKFFLPILMMLTGMQANGAPVTDPVALNNQVASTPAITPTKSGAQPARGRPIVVLGDSLTDGINGALCQKFNTCNLAQVGAHLSYIDDNRIAQVPKGAAVIMSMGVNDIDKARPMSKAAVDAYAQHLVERACEVRDRRGATVTLNNIAVRDANPVWAANIKAVNDAVKAQADKNGIKITDVSQVQDWANTLHKTGAGYQQMASRDLKTLGLQA